ncbi:MAG TPA: formylglycine-generating enzyme family protein, partial [Verrucomicrobiota bacterium]|nr:formylglycine-generating enzyme family protein [Verrucomicrobiota bacterium]
MTSTSRSHPKSFSSFLLPATILTVALLAFEPVVFGQAGDPGGDTVSKDLSLDLGKGVSMKLVLIPAGKFKMGNHDTPPETIKKVGGKEEHLSDEYPAHEVTISKPFYMGTYELTQAQWKAVMGTEPWMTKTALGYARAQPRPGNIDDYPAVWMSSYDAIEFCRKLSKKTGRTVSLPTEAQWEYACRAGSTTTFSFGDELSKLIDHGWYGGLATGQKEDYAHRIGQRKPNAWGLYDMHGNVWEFCSDWYDKDFYSRSPSVDPENTTETDLRCLRSGSFHSVPAVSRSAQRARWVGPKQVRYNYGMRVVVATGASAKDQLKSHFKPIFEKFGQNSTTKIKVVSGP